MTMSHQGRTGWSASGLLFWPLCAVGLALVALAVLGPEAERRLVLQRQIDAMQAEVDLLHETAGQLAAADKALRDDPEYRERIVRHELGITRPGEVRMRQPVKTGATAPDAPAPVRSLDPFRAASPLPEWLGLVASFADPGIRTLSMATGGTMLLAGILLSLPRPRPRPSRPAPPAARD